MYEVWRSVRTAWGVSGPSRSVLASCVLGGRRNGAGLWRLYGMAGCGAERAQGVGGRPGRPRCVDVSSEGVGGKNTAKVHGEGRHGRACGLSGLSTAGPGRGQPAPDAQTAFGRSRRGHGPMACTVAETGMRCGGTLHAAVHAYHRCLPRGAYLRPQGAQQQQQALVTPVHHAAAPDLQRTKA